MEEGEEEDDEDDWEDVDTDEEDDIEDDEGESREEAVAAGSCSRHFAPRGNPQDDAYHRMMLGLDDDEPDRRPRFNDYAMTSANTNRSEGKFTHQQHPVVGRRFASLLISSLFFFMHCGLLWCMT